MRNTTRFVLGFVILAVTTSGAAAQDKGPIAELTRLLKDENVTLRQAAAHALKYFPTDDRESKAVSKALVEALGDEDSVVSDNAADALALMFPGYAVPVLTDALKNANADVRQRAATTLARFRGYAVDAIPDLIRLLKDPNASVREAAEKALAKLQGDRWR